MKGVISRFTPLFLKKVLNTEGFYIDKFMVFASNIIGYKNTVLDVGAGSKPYKKHFLHTTYQSCDIVGKHDFLCSADKIPVPDNTYDCLIATQMLEHVEYPQRVVNEFYRVLRKGGQLFLTAPQGWGIHGEPYHYYNFTMYGLQSLFKNSGFQIEFIKPRGGMFWYLSKRIQTLPFYVLQQYFFEKENGVVKFKPTIIGILLVPLWLVSIPFCNLLIPLTFYFLDKLDKKQDYTLGYSCYCTKN